tara:strand:+ start:517 stop:921 length:405 start_codon:yes stop_codon:yes gene_type:complete
MKKIIQKSLKIFILFLYPIFYLFIYPPDLQALDQGITRAQDAVGKRFASKFCEAKEKGFSSNSSSEFALNNTYLKFVAFPDDDEFVDNLWSFTIEQIRKECGEYVTQYEENELKEFFEEEGEIASNRDLYLPNQ